MTRLAVFDLDGTLVDSRATISAAMAQACEAVGLAPPSYDETRRIVGLSLTEALRTLLPALAPARYPELGEAYRNAFLANRTAGVDEPLYAGARRTLTRLKAEGWRLGVATGKSRRGIDHIFRHHDLTHLFECAFCADDGPGKPDPHMLRLNMETLRAEPDRTVMVGDTSVDMAMARAAGVHALGVSWGFHTAEEISAGGAHEVADDFDALGQALTRWSAA